MRSCAVGSRGGAELGDVAELGRLQPTRRLLVIDAELCTAIEIQPYSCTATVCRIVVVGVAAVGARSVRQLFVSCTYETSQFGQLPGTGRIDVTRRASPDSRTLLQPLRFFSDSCHSQQYERKRYICVPLEASNVHSRSYLGRK
jgi:hypothetical protein